MSNKTKAALSIIFIAATFGLFGFMIWYTAFRLSAHFGAISFLTFLIITAIAAIGSVVISFSTGKFLNLFVSILHITNGYIFLFFVYSFLSFAAAHIVQLIWNPPLVWSGFAALTISFAAAFTGAIFGASFSVKKTDIKIKNMKSEITVLLFSDIHLGHQRGKAYLQKIVDKANALNPDLVFIAGDLVDTEPAFKPGVLDVLSGFKAPVYFTEGNHDEYLGSERLQKLLKQYGVHILRNEVVQTHGVQLIGLNYMNADENAFDMHPSDDQDTVKSVLAKMPLESDIPSILLQHSPVGVQYAEAAGIDLMLAGHTHGGQIFPFTLIARLSFSLSGGLYRHGKTQTLVSKGAGTFMMRARLGTFNEINLLRLIPEN